MRYTHQFARRARFSPTALKSIFAGVLLVSFGLFSAMPASAQKQTPELSYDQVRFTVTATASVENDRLRAVLFAQREAADAAKASDEVNELIQWAVEQARSEPKVKTRTLAYRTHPRYRDQRIDGWRVHQAMELRSADAAALTSLLGKLQARLGLESVAYELSRAKIAATEDRLVNEVIAAFERRAQTVAKQMGRRGYRLVEMNIGTGNTRALRIRLHGGQ